MPPRGTHSGTTGTRPFDGLTLRVSGIDGASVLLLAATAYVLSALLPLLLLLYVPDTGRSDAWVATMLIMVWAGLRLAGRIASGEPRLFDFVFWLFTYIFMGLAPTVQIRSEAISSTTPGINPSFDARTAAAIWVGVVAYEIGMLWGRERRRFKARDRAESVTRVVGSRDTMDPVRALILSAVGIVSALYLIQAIGLSTLFVSRQASYLVRDAALPDVSVRAVVEAAASVPLLVAAGVFILLRRASAPSRSRDLLTLGVASTVIPVLIVVNPISSARYEFGTIGFALIVMAGAMSSRQRSRASMVAIVAAFLFVFPIADAFRRQDVFGVQRSGFFGEYMANGDYDAFWQVANSLAYLEDVGLRLGHQFMGALLFWVPRSIWPGKPVDSGIELANFRGYGFTNLSAPLWSELLINGSWVALVCGFVALGLLFFWLDNRISLSLLSHGQYWSLVGAIFPFLMVILLRGSLLQAMGTFAVAVAAVLFVRKRGRPTTSATTGYP